MASRWNGEHSPGCRTSIYARLIVVLQCTPPEYESFITAPDIDERLTGPDGVTLVLIDGPTELVDSAGSLPVVVGYVGSELGGVGPGEVDVVVGADDVDALVDSVAANPDAATALVVLLRAVEHVPVELALAMESATYSMLQGGPEFARWRGDTDAVVRREPPVVTAERIDSQLTITLDRPQRHNAITAQLRDELSAALTVPLVDDTIESIVLRGNGPSFCSGGDLSEFGSRPDPVVGHRTRLARSPARLIHRLRDRITVEIHGAALGGGIEMAAFAGRVVAHPATRIALPEVSLGLIPGAGGTVSITARAGRRRTAALALTGAMIDAATARRWGIVDEITPT